MIGVTLVLLLMVVSGILSNSLTIIALSGIIVSVLMKFNKVLSKAYIWYVLFFAIGIVTFIFYTSPYLIVFSRGFVGYAFFLVVMFAGVFPNKLGVTRTLKRYRGELSILGFISISAHALLHIFQVIGTADIFGIAAYVIMIPLTFISFKVIRKEIPIKEWFTIQKGAYFIYILLFAHLIAVSAWENKIIYAVLLTLYINNKLIKEFKK